MNKKGEIITYLPFKKYLILVSIVIILGGLYYFFVLHYNGLITIKASCPEGVVPNRIILDTGDNGQIICHMNLNLGGFRDGNCVNTWLDGTKMAGLYCMRGYKEGQNVNYAYCDNILYSNTPVSSTGDVGKTINLQISLVIDPKDKTEEGYKIIRYSCKH